MLTISIIFAILVALWGFSGTLASLRQARFAQAKARPRAVAITRPVAGRARAPRARAGTRPVASA